MCPSPSSLGGSSCQHHPKSQQIPAAPAPPLLHPSPLPWKRLLVTPWLPVRIPERGAGREPGAAGAQAVGPALPKSSAESFKEPLALIPDTSTPKIFTGEDSSADPAARLLPQPLFFFQEKSLPLLFQLISATFQAPAAPKALPYFASNWDKCSTSTRPCLCESRWLQSLGICGIC